MRVSHTSKLYFGNCGLLLVNLAVVGPLFFSLSICGYSGSTSQQSYVHPPNFLIFSYKCNSDMLQ